jgi:hypothetical protein
MLWNWKIHTIQHKSLSLYPVLTQLISLTFSQCIYQRLVQYYPLYTSATHVRFPSQNICISCFPMLAVCSTLTVLQYYSARVNCVSC